MATVKTDIRAQMPTAGQNSNGLWVKRSYYVIGLAGATDTRIARALTDPAIPLYGSVLTFDVQGGAASLLVINKNAKTHPDHGDVVQVDVEWGVPQALDATQPSLDPVSAIEVGGSLQTVQTMHDVNGELIVAEYIEDTGVSSVPRTQPVLIEYQQPLMMRRLNRKEPGDQKMPIENKAKRYLGAINATPIWGEGKRRWLCTELVGRSSDYGLSYEVNYAFELARGNYNWHAIGVYQNPDGTTPNDISPILINPDTGELMAPSNGLVLAKLYPPQVFQRLNL